MNTKYQKVTVFKYNCGDLPVNGPDKGWIFEEVNVIPSTSPYSQKPGLYIDNDTRMAYRYSEFNDNPDNIPNNINISDQIKIQCTVYYKYVIVENGIRSKEFWCSCKEDSLQDCYDLSLGKFRIPQLNADIGENARIEIVSGPHKEPKD